MSTPQLGRRLCLRRAAGLGLGGAALALAGCGFQLRRPPHLQLKRICVTGLSRSSPVAEELRRQLLASPGVELMEAPLGADVVVQVLEDSRDEVVAVSTSVGLVRELTLRARLRFRAQTPGGQELIAPTQLIQQRDMSYTESTALAKEHEATMLYRAMSVDLAGQLTRRLASLTPEALLPPAAAASSAPGEDAVPAAAASVAPAASRP